MAFETSDDLLHSGGRRLELFILRAKQGANTEDFFFFLKAIIIKYTKEYSLCIFEMTV